MIDRLHPLQELQQRGRSVVGLRGLISSRSARTYLDYDNVQTLLSQDAT